MGGNALTYLHRSTNTKGGTVFSQCDVHWEQPTLLSSKFWDPNISYRFTQGEIPQRCTVRAEPYAPDPVKNPRWCKARLVREPAI